MGQIEIRGERAWADVALLCEAEILAMECKPQVLYGKSEHVSIKSISSIHAFGDVLLG